MASLGKRLLTGIGPPLAAWIIRILHRSMRIGYVDRHLPEKFWNENRQVILAFWHDQLLLMIKGYHGPGARILISPSGDGELIARTMACFGQGAVRGSSSRGGSAALREMVKLAREPYDLVVTPDGPKGPRHQVKMGVVKLAKLTRRPVVPMAFVASRGHRFGSWDRFLLPCPFARGVYAFGEPLYFAEDESFEVFGERLRQAMEANTAKAETYLEERGVSAV